MQRALLLLALLALFVGGCAASAKKNTDTTNTCSSSGGFGCVTGLVRNASTSAPLAGVAVAVSSTSVTGTTDSTGRFFLSAVPVGSAQEVTFARSGFQSTSNMVEVTDGATADAGTVSMSLVATGGTPLGEAFVPTAADSYEPDNTPAQAGVLVVDGPLQARTLFGPNDDDWVKVTLTAGTTYEFFATDLNETADTYLYLFDMDGVALLDENDDYLDFDSHIEFRPTVSGTYYLLVQAYEPPYGIATYTLGAKTLVDFDDDLWSAFYDCDDNVSTINPWASETAGDNIDQTCSGVDQPIGTVADAAEPDDDIANAKVMVESGGSYEEIIYRSDIYAGNGRTLHTGSNVDFFRVVVPAWGRIYLDLADYTVSVDVELFGSNLVSQGTFSYDDYLTNDTASPVTYYLKYYSYDGESTGWYVPFYINLGTDQDGDGYYTGEWASSRDCDDSDPNIYDNATEASETDGVDSNCDGADGYATVFGGGGSGELMPPAGASGGHRPPKAFRLPKAHR